MDVNVSYPLVVIPPEQGTLVPVEVEVIIDIEPPRDAETELRGFLAFLWQHFCTLTALFLIALALLRRLKLEIIQLRQQANYWHAQHQRAVQREDKLKEQIHLLQGEIRELKRRIFGRRTETSSATQPTTNPNCGEPFEEIPGTTDGDILEIDVRAHRRRYRRQRYRRTCNCPQQPAVVAAPPPDKLLPKSNLGISVWAMILQHKFEFFQPLHRVLAELRSHDLHLAAGTITGGLQKLVPLFQPLYEILADHNREAEHWHCDETRWRVFVKRDDKVGFVWQLWVFAAKDSIVFVLDPTRAHDVPENYFDNREDVR